MNENLVHRRAMMETTSEFMAANNGIWNGIPKIVSTVAILDAKIADINATEEVQAAAQVTPGKDKTALKMKIATTADQLNDLIEVFASLSGNSALARKMSDSKSSLYKLNGAAFKVKIRSILIELTENSEILSTEYGMDTELLTELKTDMEAYEAIENMPRKFKVKLGVATETIDRLMKEATVLLEDQLDKLVKIFKSRDEAFYNAYLRSRMVID